MGAWVMGRSPAYFWKSQGIASFSIRLLVSLFLDHFFAAQPGEDRLYSNVLGSWYRIIQTNSYALKQVAARK